MRLNKLTLQGYKTFAMRTDFVFDGNITAIVGPNGSGKSNIADSIRWVLGEQSYLTLRGKRTSDMIFAGGRNRSRSGMAQVLLTLDNTEGWLPIDFTEIEIGRRAYRSGENDYLLNGQKVRLRDISDLLANSGLSERTYTIIGQGLVDRALSLRPDERRVLFEEAAGIGLYKNKRADALRKLDETQTNLARVHDILTEITPQLRKLNRQSNKVRNYEQVASDLRNQLRLWYGYRWRSERLQLRSSREYQAQAEKGWMDGQQLQKVLRQDIEIQRKAVQKHRTDIQQIQEQRDAVKEELEKTRRLQVAAKERQLMIKQESERVDQRLELLSQSIEELKAKLHQAMDELISSSQEQEIVEKFLLDFEQDIGGQQRKIDELESSQRAIGQELRDIARERAKSEGQLIQIDERIVSINDTQEDIDDLERKREKLNLAIESVEVNTNELDKHRMELSSAKDITRAFEAEKELLTRKLDATKSALEVLQAEIIKQNSQLELYNQHTEFGQDLSENIGVHGWISEYVSVETRYETALRAALSEGRDALLATDKDALWHLVEYGLREDKSFLATTLNGNTQESQTYDYPDFGMRLSDLVEIEGDITDIVKRLFSTIYLIEDLKLGLAHLYEFPPGAMLVTLDGVILKDGGLVRYRSSEDITLHERRQAKLLEVKGSLAKKQLELAELEKNKESEAVQIADVDEKIARHLEEVVILEEKVQSESDQLAKEILNRDRLQQAYENDSRRKEQMVREEELIRQQKEQLTAEITKLDNRQASLEDELESVEQELLLLPVAETRQERKLLTQQVQSARTISAGRQAVVDSRRSTLDQIQEQFDQAMMHKDALLKQENSLDVEESSSQVELLREKHRTLEQSLAPKNQELELSTVQLNELEKELDRQLQHNSSLEASYTQARIDHAKQENRVDGLKERIIAELGLVELAADDDETVQSPLPMTDVVDELPEVSEVPDDIEETIQRLRGQLVRMGPINPDAPAEYDELQDRHHFLVNQVEDLETTGKRLSRIIADLDELTSRSFAETVREVDGEFRQVFTRLFGGGSAQLTLTDPEDIALSGVDIVARLPGRREQNLGLLSGGERALTAAALIFSLLKVSPTPFCVLDEVDAMLDEANIRRFREMLCELSVATQFVVITHNRGTIEVADNVYGVSMGADSASQVISIKPEEYVKA